MGAPVFPDDKTYDRCRTVYVFCNIDVLSHPLALCSEYDKPFIVRPESWMDVIKDHAGLVFICLIAVVLHAYSIVTRPILMIGDEPLHLQGGLWIYNYLDNNYHKYNQLLFWTLFSLTIFLKRTKQ